jgi:hypothetical protein
MSFLSVTSPPHPSLTPRPWDFDIFEPQTSRKSSIHAAYMRQQLLLLLSSVAPPHHARDPCGIDAVESHSGTMDVASSVGQGRIEHDHALFLLQEQLRGLWYEWENTPIHTGKTNRWQSTKTSLQS